MEDIREDFILCIDPADLRIENLPNFVFICGGIRNPVNAPRPGSMRDALLLRITQTDRELNERIREAEEFQDWLEHSNVDNLIDFEIVLADMASSVVLIVEGPGAYAELGSFSIIESISRKLITIFNMNTVIDKSFINLGVIKYLEDNKRTILRYRWGIEYRTTPLRDNVSLILKDELEEINSKADIILVNLKEEIRKKTQSSIKFNKDIKGHVCLVIADLIYIFSALKINEIKKFLSAGFDIELSLKKIKEYLYILENLEFVTKEESGDIFYVATQNNNGFVKYRYNENKKSTTTFENVNDVKTHTILYYRSTDASRRDVLNR